MGLLVYAELSRPVRVVASSVVSVALAAALSACAATAPNPITVAPVQARSASIATLAFGAWEQELAPAITRAEVVARLAAAQTRDGRLSPAAAQAIHSHLTRARAALAEARRGNRAAPTPENHAALAEATRLTALAASLLEP